MTLDAGDPSAYRTRMLYYKDIVSEPLPGLLVPSFGVLLQKYALIAVAALVVVIVLIVLLIRKIRRNRKKKKAART